MSQEKKSKKTSRVQVHDSEQLASQMAHLTEALQRERADAVNIRRRHDEQTANLKNVVKANVVRELLPAIDNLERSLIHTPAELADHDYVKGVQGVVKQFGKALADIGVVRILTVGQPFDPRYHEAVSMDLSPEVSAQGGEGSPSTSSGQAALVEVVSEELQAGYRLNEEIIRHAMVRVRMQ